MQSDPVGNSAHGASPSRLRRSSAEGKAERGGWKKSWGVRLEAYTRRGHQHDRSHSMPAAFYTNSMADEEDESPPKSKSNSTSVGKSKAGPSPLVVTGSAEFGGAKERFHGNPVFTPYPEPSRTPNGAVTALVERRVQKVRPRQ
eukprot:1746835-Pyramimonas_sp.AAC.1